MTEPKPDRRDEDNYCFVMVTDPVTGHRHRCGKPAISAVEAWPFCIEHQP